MKTINLLSMSNGSIETVDDGAVLHAPNGFKIKLSSLQYNTMQLWLHVIDKCNLPRRMAVGDLFFTLDNVNDAKPELYEVQYKATVEALIVNKNDEYPLIPFVYNEDNYLQLDDTIFAIRIGENMAELVIAAGLVATPALLEVSDNPRRDFSALFDAALVSEDCGRLTAVIRRIPVLNAQPRVLALAQSLELFPELTAEEAQAQAAAAEEERKIAQAEAMMPFRSFLDAIFECADSMMKPVVMPEPEEKAA